MANEQYAFIERTKVPSASQWQAAIDAAGFDLQLNPSLEPFEHSGFLPCTLFGADSGVETYYDRASEVISDPDLLNKLCGGRDFCISFRWGGSLREAACAMILSYALAQACEAVVSYEGDAPYVSLEALRTDTEELLREAQKSNA